MTIVDFHSLGDKLWSIANIFRDDTLKTTEYLEEFSYFLFLKLFDDQEKQKEEMAKIDGKPYTPYLPEKFRFYNWANKIVNGEVDFNEVVHTVKNIFEELANIKNHDDKDLSLFRRLFQNHIWRIKYGPTIRDLLKKLIDLKLEQNFDVMGRAYEFVVQKLGEQKQYGQYFTPRHIIHFMVDLADPDIGEKIYDPAAGTGGFILRAFELVKDKIEKRSKNTFTGVKEATSNYGDIGFDEAEKLFRDLKEKNLYAVEKAPDVYKLALMNMILHNDGKSNLQEADSLDNRAQVECKEKYDVILTNPPYGPLTQSRVGMFDYHVKRFEALFIQHIMTALKFSAEGKKPSRAVVIILDKILFDNSNAYVNIRKKLLREYNLKAVFSMPAGIFQPYNGVKTTILYFERPTKDEWNRTKAGNNCSTKNVLFFDVRSDGFTLSTLRHSINQAFQGDNSNIYTPPCGDLPKAVGVFKEWKSALEQKNIDKFVKKYKDNEHILVADIEKIKEKNFNLNPGLYRKVENGKNKYFIKLGEVLEVLNEERKFQIEEEELYKEPTISSRDNVLSVSMIEKRPRIVKGKDLKVKTRYLIKRGDLVFSLMHTQNGSFAISNDEYAATNTFLITKIKEDIINPKFLAYLLKDSLKNLHSIDSVGRENYRKDDILNLEIPFPSIKAQQQIVERLNKQQAIIEKTSEMEKAILEAGIDNAIFEGNWKWVELGKISELVRGPFGGSLKKEIFVNSGYAVYEQSHAINDDFSKIRYFITEEKFKEMKRFELKPNDLIMSCSGTIGKVAIVPQHILGGIINQALLKITPLGIISPQFLKYFLESFFQNPKEDLIYGSGIQNITSVGVLKSLKIPLPPLEKQKEIVESFDAQFETLKNIQRLRENAEKTIKLILTKEVFSNV